jgi:TIR domain/WD domain, G-beta repeat
MSAATPRERERIFISYRRDDPYEARWLYDLLCAHLGRAQVFMDVDSVEPGDDFIRVLEEVLGSCQVLLALIGERWLDMTDDETGHRRLDLPSDFVRLEIETALRRDVRVIPILFGRAVMPKSEQLPDSLRGFEKKQALRLSANRFVSDLTDRLLPVIDKTLKEMGGGLARTDSGGINDQQASSTSPRATGRAKALQTIDPGPPIRAIAWDPDGRRIVVATNDDTISSENIAGKQPKQSPVIQDRGGEFASRWIVDLAFSPQGDRLATAISYPRFSAGSPIRDQGAVKLWDTANGEQLLEIGSLVVATAVAYSPDGTRLATAGADNRAYIWNVGDANGTPLQHFPHAGPVTAVSFNDDGTRLATGSADQTVRIWDVADGSQLELLRHDKAVSAVAFSPDGTHLATATEDSARIWNADNRELLHELPHDDDEVTAVSFNDDGTRLATGSADQTVRIWDVADGSQLELLHHGEPVSAVAFSPDGTQLATAGADIARIWDVAGL